MFSNNAFLYQKWRCKMGKNINKRKEAERRKKIAAERSATAREGKLSPKPNFGQSPATRKVLREHDERLNPTPTFADFIIAKAQKNDSFRDLPTDPIESRKMAIEKFKPISDPPAYWYEINGLVFNN